MPPSIDDDYTNSILTQLYSRKATKKAFTMIARDYKKATGKDLCQVVRRAQSEISQKIAEDASQSDKFIAGGLRTDMFKLIDYSTWLKYCEVEK